MNKYIITIFIVIVAMIISCNDDFMDRYPIDKVSNATFWNTTSDYESFINGIYDMTQSGAYANSIGITQTHILLGFGGSVSWNASSMAAPYLDGQSDNMSTTSSYHSAYSAIRTGKNMPATSLWDRTNFGGWWWWILRSCNVFLENYDKANIAVEIKNKYVAEVKLFRAWFYWDKVKKFGNVPLFTNSLNIDNTDILYGPRDSRNKVMELVLEDLNFACEYLPETWNNGSPGWMGKWSALALKSKICLYEGTYRKYHGGSDAEKWLSEAVDASKKIIESGKFSIFSKGDPNNDYRTLFSSLDLSSNPEIIYWKKYIAGINGTCFQSIGRSNMGGATKDAVEDYLCIDGLPINQSPLYLGDDSIELVFANRDPRLRQTILHPDDAANILDQTQWRYPRIKGMSGGIPSETGYLLIKFYNKTQTLWDQCAIAAVILRYGEVLLDYAEAKAELGTITQYDLDISINKLRDRVNMPRIDINNVVEDSRYFIYGISPLLAEIRRERRVETFAENGIRYDDLIRWKIADKKLNQPALGLLWDAKAEARFVGANIKTSVDPSTGKTYIDVFKGTNYDNPTFTNKNYLWPIPIWALSENPNLGQNPGF